MRGLLIVFENGESRIEELPKDVLHLALDRDNRLIVQHAGCVSNPLAVLEWKEAQSTWLMSQAGGIAASVTFLKGSAVPKHLLLNDGDSLNVGSSILLFRRFPAPPVFRGKPCAEIPLRKVSRLCFGRVADAAVGGRGACAPRFRGPPDLAAPFAALAPGRGFSGARRESDRDVSQRTAF